MRGDRQNKILEDLIRKTRDASASFQTALAVSRFTYRVDDYKEFFERLDCALTNVGEYKVNHSSGNELESHLAFLGRGISEPLFYLQTESSANLRADNEAGADEHNKRWDFEIHQMKSILQLIAYSMYDVKRHIDIQLRLKFNSSGPPSVT